MVILTLLYLFGCSEKKSDGLPAGDYSESQPESMFPEVDVQIAHSGPIHCTDPQRRSESPMYLADLGDIWSTQPVEGYTPSADRMVGGEGVVVGDFTEDQRLDIFVPTLDRDLFFVQQSDGSFKESAAEYFPERQASVTMGASAVDYDGDEDLDLFVLNVDTPHQLLENKGGVFEDVSIEMGIVQERYDSFGLTWGDADQDGDLDLLVLNTGYGPLGPPPWNDSANFEVAGPNVLYNFTLGESYSINSLPNHTPEPYSCCAAFVDVNLDFVQDLYIVNDFGMYVQPNQLFFGDETGSLTPKSNYGIDIGMYGMGLAVGDINNDNYPDFTVTDWGRNWLFLSDGYGQWYDDTISSGFVAQSDTQQVGWGIELHDFDNDSDVDAWVGYGYLSMDAEEQESFDSLGLYNTRYQPDALFLQEEGQFTDVASDWGIDRESITRGGIWADINDDGFLDFISTAIDGPVEAYLANCDDSNWLRIKLHQPGTLNTSAVGARIKVFTESKTQLRWVLAGTSLSSSGPVEAHFGLGDAERIERIQIVWPDQTVSNLYHIDGNQILNVTRME